MVGSTLLAGCVGDLLGDEEEPTPENGENECDIAEGVWDATGDQTHLVKMIDEADDVGAACATIAADAALETLNRRLEMDVLDVAWIQTMAREDDEWYVEVHAGYTLDADGNIAACPPDAYDVVTFREHTPSVVSVSMAIEETGEQYECSHEVIFRSEGPLDEVNQ